MIKQHFAYCYKSTFTLLLCQAKDTKKISSLFTLKKSLFIFLYLNMDETVYYEIGIQTKGTFYKQQSL